MIYPQAFITSKATGHRARIVTVAYGRYPDQVTATGEALRHPNDKNDPIVAEYLAVGRALEALGRKLQKRANGLVKHHDDVSQPKASEEEGPVPDGRCHRLTVEGNRCRNRVSEDDLYCHLHDF